MSPDSGVFALEEELSPHLFALQGLPEKNPADRERRTSLASENTASGRDGGGRYRLHAARNIPANWRSRWIEFVVRPKLWQGCATGLVSAVLVAGMQVFFGRVVFFSDRSAVWWPADGIGLGALLIARRRHWPAMLAGFAAGVAFSERAEPPHTYLAAGLFNTLQVWLPALALPRFRTMDRWLAQPGIAMRFTLWGVIVASAVSGLTGAAYAHGRPGESYWFAALRWGAGDALGCALAAPLMLALASRETLLLFRPPAFVKTVALLTLMIAASWMLFRQTSLPIGFALYPLILLLGTQLGLSGAVIAINLLAVIATDATLHGKGPFGASVIGVESLRILLLQSYLGLSVSMTLPVSVARVYRQTTEVKLKRAWAAMEALTTLDGLTGIANRRRFDEVLDQEWKRAARERTPLSLLLLDVDRFKAFNDTYGHLTGDACLRSVAKAIASVPGRQGDLVARYGGEEFVVLLPGSDRVGAAWVAERIRSVIQSLALPHRASETSCVTVSVGLATAVPDKDGDRLLLIAIADKALYNAKELGRNRVCTAVDPVGVLA